MVAKGRPGQLIAKPFRPITLLPFMGKQIANATASKHIDKECAQGSKCGCGLFLIAMKKLLSILQREGVQTFAYADDLFFVLEGHKTKHA